MWTFVSQQEQLKQAVVILHEIYGLNDFIEELCISYQQKGYAVFAPNLLKREITFAYEQETEAYTYFNQQVGFKIVKQVERLINDLKEEYEQVIVIGFSVGATLAWLCCENSNCAAVVCFYGSRIRDYLHLQPVCPALVLFASEDLFEVDKVIELLSGKANLESKKITGRHGFMDSYGKKFSFTSNLEAQKSVELFLAELETMI
ncbi:dienelactone hydrolase family protein [Succinispira mobilis]|uniref:dienelactone hydrolase family protein n=1 Tax=Succinispira mobilis TaxID=78120 RepID=UPI00037DAC16|nr:dienelactone hydrolase family protein [Succinispira mobilis]